MLAPCLLFPLAALPVQRPVAVDFQGMAHEFLGAHELEPDGLTFAGLLSGPAFAGVSLGGIDVYVPVASLENSEVAGELGTFAEELIDLQQAWFAWRGTEADASSIAEDWKTLRKWAGGWSARKLAHVDGGPETLYDQLQASDKVLAAQGRLSEYARFPKATGDAVGERSVMVLAPTRLDFAQLIALGGLLETSQRDALWTLDMTRKAGTWVNWIQIVALEYPASPFDPADPFRGASITEQDSTALRQHVADRGAALLLRKEFYRHGTHFFEEALGIDLVITVAGRNSLDAGDWVFEWKTSGARTEAYQRFVPGGNPSGGVLPARKAGPGALTINASAVSRYRADGGEDYFLKALRDGQKDGAKLVDRDHPLGKDKTAHFALSASESGGRIAISAPFLGAQALDKPLPRHEYLDDYEDLYRAYRCLFVHWLRESGAGSPEESAARFSKLIAEQAGRQVGTPVHEIVADVYGLPMSAPDGSVDSLEWRFLSWLAKR